MQTKPPHSDFETQNIEAVRGEARLKNPDDLLDYGKVYNYGGQFLQYVDMQVGDAYEMRCDALRFNVRQCDAVPCNELQRAATRYTELQKRWPSQMQCT